MTEHEFYHDYMQAIYASSDNDFTEEKFTEEMCDFLVDNAVIENYDSVFFKKDRQGRIDAWYFNRDKKELSLFICDFSPSSELRSLTQSDIEQYFKRAERFFLQARTDKFYQGLEESLPIYSVARDIHQNITQISKVKFYLLSNGKISDRFKGLGNKEIEGFDAVYDIWDMGRRARIAQSGKDKEDIVIDFTEFVANGIPCLQAFTGSSACKSYLLAMPGEMLAEVYDKYGERLLEQNVRTFLQFRGGVNKGIRNTLKNEPEMFFAYNNGLTVTAEHVVFSENRMLTAKNLQIVNGGQTTASIFMAKLQDKNNVNLENVYIPVKLSVIEQDKVDSVVPIISQCANTQNKVSAADFFSNHPFHKRIEDFSRRILAPSRDGGLIETHWFYERARGQYSNKQAKMTVSEKKIFTKSNPKPQMFTKTDAAKFENSFAQLPHYVSKGAQWNFGKFAEEICGKGDSEKGLWEKNELQFNELYFKQLIAKAILFIYLDKNIMRQRDWYRGYKANIITYTLAKFANVVAEKGRFIDFMSIWNKQDLSTALKRQLLNLAKIINEAITDTDENVTQYCKKELCWEKIKSLDIKINADVVNELIEPEEEGSQGIDARKDQKILNDINAQLTVYDKGLEHWTALISWAKEENKLTEKEMSILSSTLRMNVSPPSEKQCKVILRIEHKAVQEGFFINE